MLRRIVVNCDGVPNIGNNCKFFSVNEIRPDAAISPPPQVINPIRAEKRVMILRRHCGLGCIKVATTSFSLTHFLTSVRENSWLAFRNLHFE